MKWRMNWSNRHKRMVVILVVLRYFLLFFLPTRSGGSLDRLRWGRTSPDSVRVKDEVRSDKRSSTPVEEGSGHLPY